MSNPAEFLEQQREQLRRRWAARASEGGQTSRATLDWRAYFRTFCERHGRFPLMHMGRLLFPDGWQYSATDHAGPEWRPPEDRAELLKLMRIYWYLRRKAVRRTLPAARAWLDQLGEMAATHDMPILQKVTTWDPDAGEHGQARSDTRPVDVEAARQKVAWLERDLLVCELRILNPEAAEDEVEQSPAVLAVGEGT